MKHSTLPLRPAAIKKFQELLEANPGKYILVTEEGEGFVLSAEDEVAKIVRERGLRKFYFSHEPPADMKYFIYTSETS